MDPGCFFPMKKMKLMTGDDCIEFVDGLSPGELAETEHRLNPAMCEGEPGWLAEGLMRGHYKVTTTHDNGRPLYRYVWHVNDQNFLHVNADRLAAGDDTGDTTLRMRKAEINRPCDGGSRDERSAMAIRRKGPIRWFDLRCETGKRDAEKAVRKNILSLMALEHEAFSALLFR